VKKNLYILTEESIGTIEISKILNETSKQYLIDINFLKIKIIPSIEKGKFLHEYKVAGFESSDIADIFIYTIGPSESKSPFVDYLVYLNDKKPDPTKMFTNCIFAIEATKTNTYDSRNTAMGQRSSKFVHLNYYLEKLNEKTVPVMYKTQDQTGDTDSVEFIGRLLNHLPIKTQFWGTNIDSYKKFKSLDEMISVKNKIAETNTRNNDTPIFIRRVKEKIYISGKLSNPGSSGSSSHKYTGRIGHDPNQGQLSIIAKSIRDFGFTGPIEIIDHDLKQEAVIRQNNKFTKFANYIDFTIENCKINQGTFNNLYFKYLEKGSEKIASILAQVILVNKGMVTIFENHGGCEKSFLNLGIDKKKPNLFPFPKSYSVKGRKIPDLIMLDKNKKKIYLYEGKTAKNKKKGIEEIKFYGDLEKNILSVNYPGYTFERKLILEGGIKDIDPLISFQLDDRGYVNMKNEFL
tara:strand:- start:329 stop:1714 length:1386 start_codon:yes stop_codon:yes gene_type:complete